MGISSYKDLVAWQKGMDLVMLVYPITRVLPRDEQFVLVQQIRRAAISVPSNIAEGHGRSTRADFMRFLDMAVGSLNEMETQLLLCVRLQYINDIQISAAALLIQELQRILHGLISSLGVSCKTGVR